MAYYDPDSVLMESQKVPVTFELEVPGLAYLNNGSAIEKGTKLELPIWIASMLVASSMTSPPSQLVSLEIPEAVGDRVMNALNADPKSVNVRHQARYFYNLGERILELFDDEQMIEVLTDVRVRLRNEKLAHVSVTMYQTFKQRALEMADKAQNMRTIHHGDGATAFTNTADETERSRKQQ
jgi:GINS complex subunit 3